ncbi:MAG: Spi family protease inhibitor, partial [Tannerella sp.]|nr:Spi family protease inhibitor [Tannerella sp.]
MFSKRFLQAPTSLVLFIATPFTGALAAPVDIAMARKAGQAFIARQMAIRSSGDSDTLKLVYTAFAGNENVSAEPPVYYVFNDTYGFVVVAADDCVTPVLAYSWQGRFDPANIPPNARIWLDGYRQEITAAIEAGVAADAGIRSLWTEYV